MLKQMQCDDIDIRRLFRYFVELRTTHALQILGGRTPATPPPKSAPETVLSNANYVL